MRLAAASTFFLFFATALVAAPPDRIKRSVDSNQTRVVPGGLHHSAQARFDRGAADPGMPMNYMMVLMKPSSAQQADLDQLLADQQNPASARFHQWLTPEEFGNRFGLSSGDRSRVVAWLHSEGLTVNETARAGNWVAFSGTAGQVAKSLHTPIHRFEVDGEMHFANTGDPSVPDALGDVVGGFVGLNDFRLRSQARLIGPAPDKPDFNAGASHYLAPGDYATIYNINPLYQAGYDGTGQNIAIVGESDVLLADLRAFRTRFNLPANDPKMILYNGVDPGITGAQIEGNLDLEWASAIAPKATIYYIYGASAFTAVISAVNLNVAPVISISYGSCEVDVAPPAYRSVAQQGNAQGITFFSASGDSGAAGCDPQGVLPQANLGRSVDFPPVMPEVTGVGGTQFAEGAGTYWAASNSASGASALSYIPEAAWNESDITGLGATGGGASRYYPKPSWQNGPGVPADSVRHVPDIALSSAGHDGYLVVYNNSLVVVGGTSASAPSMAGITALLNHYQVSNKLLKQPGLGNINPQLYRLAQSVPSVFHDVTAGDNVVPCSQGSPDCLAGSFGYPAGAGYDMATGLGSVDANALVTKWNTTTNGVTVTLTISPAKATVNDTVTATVSVSAATGTPTGTIDFSIGSTLALGSVPLMPTGATLTFPLYRLGTGNYLLAAEYSGDAAFSPGGSTKTIQITAPVGGAGVTLTGPTETWPQPADAQGLSWQPTFTLRETGGVAAMVTGITVDGQAQVLTQFFSSPDLPANGTLTATPVFRNVTGQVTRSFVFNGVDAVGNTWSRQISVIFGALPTYNFFNLAATPLTIVQNPAADPSCQWATQLNIDDQGGFLSLISSLFVGGVDLSSQIPAIFGTTRLGALSGLQGKLCFSGIAAPATDTVQVVLSNGASESLNVSFAGPVASPAKLSATPASVSIGAAAGQTGLSGLTINTSVSTQAWTVSVFPANRTTAWLSVSQLSGVGTTFVGLKANSAGYEPGVYRANLLIESDSAVPQTLNVPVMFILGGSPPGMTITGAFNAASGQAVASPGMLMSVFGTNLGNSALGTNANPLSYAPLAGVTATVNGIAAPLLYASPGQINLQVPLEAGSGPAVLGINNGGLITGFPFQISPAAPGIFTDVGHNIVPVSAAAVGTYGTLYMTGAGDLTPAEETGFAPSAAVSASSLPKPVLPLTVTVGGVQAFVQFAGLVRGSVGVVQVNFLVPPSVAPGVQPVVVTVAGVSSAAANIAVQAPGK